MPIFGSGCHTAYQQPGSTPSELTFGFQGVLISLIPDNAFHLDVDAVMGKAILFGRRKNFQIVLFSIQNAVLLEVRDAPVAKIRRSEIIPICHISYNELCMCNRINKTDECTSSIADLLLSRHSGFATLQDFFAVAARGDVSGFSLGCFPAEILSGILKHCDVETYDSWANVQKLCRPYAMSISHFVEV